MALGERAEQARPVELRARIGFAPRRDVAVRGDILQRKRGAQHAHQLAQALVLERLESAVVSAFELDTDREIVAALAPCRRRVSAAPS